MACALDSRVGAEVGGALSCLVACLVFAAGCGASAPGPKGAGQAASTDDQGGLSADDELAATPLDLEAPAAVHAQLTQSLNRAGHQCVEREDRVLCDTEVPDRASFYVVYRAPPARLIVGSPWRLKGPCQEALPAVNAFNWAIDELTASCSEEGVLMVSGSYFVPAGGISEEDVLGFLRWWTLATVSALEKSSIGELLH